MKKLETKSTVLLKHHLKALKLPSMHSECEKVAARCAKENVDHLGFLLQLCEQGRLPFDKLDASIQGWINHVRFGDTWGLRHTVLEPVRL